MTFKTRLGQLISNNEGFNVPGSIPNRRHNPGDLRHAPHASHSGIGPDDIGIEPSDEIGEEDMERQFTLDASRGMTLREFAYSYAPPGDGNPTEAYLTSLCKGLGMNGDTPLSIALTVPPIE